MSKDTLNQKALEKACFVYASESGEDVQGVHMYEALKAYEKVKRGEIRLTRNEAVDSLKAVLCDPEGTVCIAGSQGDRDVIQKALKALEREMVASWQPIETAPKDGTEILLVAMPRPHRWDYATAYWDGKGWCWHDEDAHFGKPSHWQPITPPMINSIEGGR